MTLNSPVIPPLAGSLYGGTLYLQGLFGQAGDASTPTTILGAFIAISLSMGGLLGWVLKRMFDDREKDRVIFKDAIEVLKNSQKEALDAFKISQTVSLNHLARERAQHAELADAERRLRTNEHTWIREQMSEIHAFLKNRKGGQ